MYFKTIKYLITFEGVEHEKYNFKWVLFLWISYLGAGFFCLADRIKKQIPIEWNWVFMIFSPTRTSFTSLNYFAFLSETIGKKISENSGFVVSELVVRFGE